jgi:DNA-binding transcriptional MerR regulator
VRIGELAERSGTTTRMLRYYEEQGLLPARRTGNGYREYDETDLRLTGEILALRRIGFTVDETRPFVECLRSGHDAGDSCPASLDVYRRKLDDLDACIARLVAARDQVRGQLADAVARTSHRAAPGCEFDAPTTPAEEAP